MNAGQREFLVQKLRERTAAEISELKKALPKFPDPTLDFKKAALTGGLKLKPEAEIVQTMRDFALGSGVEKGYGSEEPDIRISYDMPTRYSSYAEEHSLRRFTIKTPVYSFFELPLEAKKKIEDWMKLEKEMLEQIKRKEELLSGLETRVRLASAKVLQGLIDDVDSLGALSLFDVHTNLIGPPKEEPKKQLGGGIGKIKLD